MDFMNDIIFLLLFRLLFSNIFRSLNRSKQLFVPLQKRAEKWRDNKKYRIGFFVVFVLIAATVSAVFDFDYIGFGVVGGAVLSLENIIFDKKHY